MVFANKRSVKLLSLILALMLLFTSFGTAALAESAEGGAEASEGAAAETGIEIPAPTAKFYVRDEEEILSTETENAIISRNESLFERYGIQIVILSLKTIPGRDINDKGAYLHRIVDSWQAGGTEEKCLMLAISAQEQNYIAIAGDGLSEEFPVQTWSQLLDQYLEPDFAAAQYDAGVQKIFTAVADKAELYAVNHSASGAEESPSADATAKPEQEEKEEKEKPAVFETILRGIAAIIFAVIVFGIVGFIVIYAHGQHVKKKRREERRRKAMQARAQQNDQQVKKPESYSEFINRY